MLNKIWRKSLIFSLVVLAGTALYAYLYFGNMADYVVLQILGVASVLVIAPSLALSGMAYFWNFADKLVIYRKSLGLLGLYLGLMHVGLSMYQSGILLSALTVSSAWGVAITAGYLSVVFFALMPLVSSVFAVRRLGGTRVRLGLRYFGYTAYVLVLVHAVLLSLPRWSDWLANGDTLLAPPTLIACVVATLVLVLRVALFMATIYKK